MQEKKVVLIRKQSTPFVVNYSIDGRTKKYVWNGTRGKILNKKSVPLEVHNWLATDTTTYQEGELILEETDDEEVNEIKENMEDAESVEKMKDIILTKEEIKEILTTGNHLSLKKKLNELTKDQPKKITESQKRYIVSVASEIGIDSSAKRKIICEW
ncbi:MAG TPA: hypothetical protein VK982_09205, partial [Bacteroidales bacterium]|nr:hypothetical protein [Bacteroidales bacterium]